MGFILKSNFSPQFIMYKTCSLETELFLSVCHHNLSALDSPKDYPKVLSDEVSTPGWRANGNRSYADREYSAGNLRIIITDLPPTSNICDWANQYWQAV